MNKMLRIFLRRLIAAVAMTALGTAACTTQEPEFLHRTPTENAELLSVEQMQRWYKAQGGTLSETAIPTPAGAIATGDTPSLNWSLLTTAQIGSERVSLVPFSDPPNPFAGSGLYAHRHLLIVQKVAQPPKAAIIEVVANTARTVGEAQTLFFDLYRKGKTRASLAQQTFTGFVFYYTLRYQFRAGRCYVQGRETLGNPQLLRSSEANGSTAVEGASQRSSTCTYVIISHSPPYTVNVCDGSGGGGGGGGYGGGGGGTSGPGGGGPRPTDYPELPGDDSTGGGSGQGPTIKFVPNMPTTMAIQTTSGSCVTSSLAEIKLALCGGNQTVTQIESAMMTYGAQRYGAIFLQTGVPLNEITSFVSHFFTTTVLFPVNNFQGAIDAGFPIAIDIPSGIDPSIWHSVIITGYAPGDPNNTVYYLDPATGTTQMGNGATLLANAHYTIPITGCR